MRKEMLLSLVLAIGVVGGLIAIAEHSLATKTIRENSSAEYKAPIGTRAVATAPALATAPVLARPSNAFHGISKCLQNGQTSYSNDGCPIGATQQQVALYDTAGIEDKSREQLAAIRATNRLTSRPAGRAEGLVIQHVAHQNTTSAADKKWECEQLKKQIDLVDASARQPQSAHSQDRLRARKKELRDRYSALRC